MTTIDSDGWTAVGREFAAEEARRSTERHDAGVLPAGTVIALVAALRSDLIARDADRERVTAGLEKLSAAGWQLPADQWLHLAGDTWRDVMQLEAGPASSS